MYANSSYIFYREIQGDGPVGAQGVALTAGRSLAVDTKLMPLGAPIWLDSTWPADTPEANRPLQRLVVAQDTGGAIKGAVRGDIFFGTGEQALDYAGRMKQPGRYYLLLPRAVDVKSVAEN
jgi:membrane-bound lytic murein transglycosylase A